MDYLAHALNAALQSCDSCIFNAIAVTSTYIFGSLFFVTRKDTAVVIRLEHREFISFHTSPPSGFACNATATGDETEIDERQ